VKLARLKKPKATCSPSFADCRPKTNVVLLWDGSPKGRLCTRGIGHGKETENLNVVDVLTVQEQIL
jgi:hypothetical protein